MKAHQVQRMASNIIGNSGKAQQEEVDEDEKDAGDVTGDFESMHIEKADNGFTVSTRHKQKPGKKGEAQPYDEGKKHVFTHADHVSDHVRHTLGGKKH